MIVVPLDRADRAFAIECLLDDLARRRITPEEAGETLAQLRAIGDVAALERLSRAVSALNRVEPGPSAGSG